MDRLARVFATFLAIILILTFLASGKSVLSGQIPARIEHREIIGFIYADEGFIEQLTTSSPGFLSGLDASGTGKFGWQFTNATGMTLRNVRVVVFLDIDIDREKNTFFNESGSLLSLTLPPESPAGSIAATSWEIDEPGFLSGDLAQHLLTGSLDNTNTMTSASRDDVSLALGFQYGTLVSGSSLTASFLISRTNISGLSQTDADSGEQIYFNGWVRSSAVPPTISTPVLSRQQGSSGIASTIASVSDDNTPAGHLTVTAVTILPGIFIGNLTNTSGTISAVVTASCLAAPGQNQVVLEVRDNDGLSTTANLIVNVTANNPPSLGSYISPAPLEIGAGIQIAPDAPPTDNGTIVSLTASAPGFTGTLNASSATGVVTIANAGPTGTFTISVSATDSCGATTIRTFGLTVRASADLSLTMSGTSGPVKDGDRLMWLLTITNRGPGTATGITVTDTLPTGLSLMACAATSGGVCGGTGETRTISFASLSPGTSVTITLSATLHASALVRGVLKNSAVVSATTADPNPANNSASVTTLLEMRDCTPPNCPEVSPGTPSALASAPGGQKPGSVLVYNYYTSNANNPVTENTRINLTNTDPGRTVFVHLFFIEGATCSPKDAWVCLTPNQTTTLMASDIDPDVAGYIIAVAVDKNNGCPIQFNSLIGDAFIRVSSGHSASLSAEAFAAITANPADCNAVDSTATLAFDGIHYNPAPRALAVDSILSTVSGSAPLLILNRLGGNLTETAGAVGSVFGLLYDDLERSYSFNFSTATCQARRILSSTFPPTAPRITSIIPAGRSGWMKVWSTESFGLLGAVLNNGSGTSALSNGHNLHSLTYTTTSRLIIPITPPSC